MGAEMSLTLPEQLRTPYQAQLAAIQECQNYFYKNGEESGFDSANGMAQLRPSTFNTAMVVNCHIHLFLQLRWMRAARLPML